MKRRTFLGGLFAASALLTANIQLAEAKPLILSEDDQFYVFFHRFNGFPINEMQRQIYQSIKTDTYKTYCGDRQSGTTILASTYAVWRAYKGDKVMFAQSTHDQITRSKREISKKCDKVGITPTPIDYMIAHELYLRPWNLHSKSYDVGVYDTQNICYYFWWDEAKHHIKGDRILFNTSDRYV